MSASLIWLVITIVLLGIEMMLGSIFILACVMGSASACIVAVFGAEVLGQSLCAGIVTILGVVVVSILNIRKKRQSDREIVDNELDLGKEVMVDSINQDGSATVNYRGTKWKAFLKEGNLEKGRYKIAKVDGARLILEK